MVDIIEETRTVIVRIDELKKFLGVSENEDVFQLMTGQVCFSIKLNLGKEVVQLGDHDLVFIINKSLGASR